MRHIPDHDTRIGVHQFGGPVRITCRAKFLDGNQSHEVPGPVGCVLAHCDVVDGAERVSPQGGPNRGQVISRRADGNVRDQIRIQTTRKDVVGS